MRADVSACGRLGVDVDGGGVCRVGRGGMCVVGEVYVFRVCVYVCV